MPILYTDGSNSADAGAATSSAASTSQQRDDRSDKKRRKKSAIGRFGRAVVKSFKSSDKNCSRHKDVEIANEKLRQINRGPACYCTADQLRKSTRSTNAYTKRSAPTLGEQNHHDLAGRLGDGMKTSSETSKDVLRYHDVSPVATRHPHGISMVAGVRTRAYSEAKSLQEDTGSLSMHMQHSETTTRVNVAVLRQEVEESFAVIEAESPVPSSSMSTANLSVSAEDLASLNTQQLPPSTGPAVLECGQMQEIKLHKSAGGDDCSHQRSVSKNTTLSDLRTASVAAAASAEFCAQVARQLKDVSVQTDMTLMPEVPPEQQHKNSRLWEALRNFFSALRDFFLCAALAHKEAAASD
ncbi:uncharacterized protein LOC119441825 isoform X1 [Dermacentor silvarum]|uniref:uncharacterized protein LOC119441825 isoform X1 n=1 Tax=Dermacentor silvarum TaxID=543639 RepID=UPI00189BCF2E|nr:uncharacterized protein LOC119441825 isoform X1 [Dermacentor silvarum]